MLEITAYLLGVIILATLLGAKILGQRYFNRSLRNRSIDPIDERRSLWKFVGLMSIGGLVIGSSIVLLQVTNQVPGTSIRILDLLCAVGLSTIGSSIFAWIAFWMIGAILQAKIESKIQKDSSERR